MTVQEHHLDTNHHVNNVQYVRLALSTLPEGLTIRRLRIMYQKQARLGDQMLPSACQTGDQTWLIRLAGKDGSPYCITEVTVL
jgi:acyl-ACP thioesterase